MKGFLPPQSKSAVSRANIKYRLPTKNSASPKSKSASPNPQGNVTILQPLALTENMVVDSPMETGGFSVQPPLSFSSTGVFASAQTQGLTDENMSQMIPVSSGVQMGGPAIVGPTNFHTGGSTIGSSANVQAGGLATVDSTDVEMVGPSESRNAALRRPQAVPRKRKL